MAASASLAFVGCGQGAPPEGDAVKNREQLPIIVTRGVSQLLSDSGAMRYRLITEEWAIFDQTNPPRQEFCKGLLILRYNEKMAIDMQITADTAICYDQNKWELRGNVYVNNEESQTTYTSQQLFWDMQEHMFYSNVWMHIVTPEREIQGSSFRSNENMTRYDVDQDKGFMPMPKDEKDEKTNVKEAENANKEATSQP